ncbi:MAG TPA: CAP domain-containing protein [Gaiellales bacterium]
MRKLLLSLITTAALVILPAAAQAASTISYQASSEQQVLTLLNQIRSQHKLTPFTASSPLRNAARAHSADMLQKSYFDHNSPTESWDARIARYLKSPLTGEDIAWGQGSYGTASGIVSQWMHSPIHRAIILTAGLHHIGLGLALGTYDGTPNAVMATADFAA